MVETCRYCLNPDVTELPVQRVENDLGAWTVTVRYCAVCKAEHGRSVVRTDPVLVPGLPGRPLNPWESQA